MSVVLDTSVVIDYLRGLPAAVDYVAAVARRPTCSEITRVEVIQGLRSGERRHADRFFAALDWEPLTTQIAETAGELGRRYRRRHTGIDTPDLVIAATAQAVGLPVAAANVRHFPMFKGLRPAYTAT